MQVHELAAAASNYLNVTLAEVRGRGFEQSGLFAKTLIRSGDLIGCYGGRAVMIDVDPVTNRYINTTWQHQQVWQLRRVGDRILGLVSTCGFESVDYINHSCRANTTIVDRIIVVASRDIEPDEEVTMDYREWDFILEGVSCWCSDPKCII
jgi:SET domain-containing protein